MEGRRVTAGFACACDAAGAALHWTTDLDSTWRERHWHTARAAIDGTAIVAELPAEKSLAYVTLVDARGCVVSSEFLHG